APTDYYVDVEFNAALQSEIGGANLHVFIPSGLAAALPGKDTNRLLTHYPTIVTQAEAEFESRSEWSKEIPKPKLSPGENAPDFTVHDMQGQPLRLSDFEGKVVLLDFWATGCGPCLQALPNLARIARKYRDRGLVVLAVNIWDEKGACQQWLREHP